MKKENDDEDTIPAEGHRFVGCLSVPNTLFLTGTAFFPPKSASKRATEDLPDLSDIELNQIKRRRRIVRHPEVVSPKAAGELLKSASPLQPEIRFVKCCIPEVLLIKDSICNNSICTGWYVQLVSTKCLVDV